MWTIARRAPFNDSIVRRISSSRACVITMSVTSSGTSFCSLRSRTVWKSVSDADGKPTSISLSPTATSVLKRRFLVSRLIGSNSAWLPSRRSVLHHTGTVVSWRLGHWRSGKSMAGNGRYFWEGSLSMAVLVRRGHNFPALGAGVFGVPVLSALTGGAYVVAARPQEAGARTKADRARRGSRRLGCGQLPCADATSVAGLTQRKGQCLSSAERLRAENP